MVLLTCRSDLRVEFTPGLKSDLGEVWVTNTKGQLVRAMLDRTIENDQLIIVNRDRSRVMR
jgi:hypothetical protein